MGQVESSMDEGGSGGGELIRVDFILMTRVQAVQAGLSGQCLLLLCHHSGCACCLNSREAGPLETSLQVAVGPGWSVHYGTSAVLLSPPLPHPDVSPQHKSDSLFCPHEGRMNHMHSRALGSHPPLFVRFSCKSPPAGRHILAM